MSQVVGTVELMISGRDAGAREDADRCICCPGPHVFGRGIAVTHEDYDYDGAPEHMTGRAEDWLWRELSKLWQEHGYDLEGQRVRISLDLVSEPDPPA